MNLDPVFDTLRPLEAVVEKAQSIEANEAIPIFACRDQVTAQAGASAFEGLLVQPRRESRKNGLRRGETKFEIRHR